MITATARKHVVRALREALRIRESHAREILAVIRNENALRLLGDTDMRTVKALVCPSSEPTPTVGLYVDAGQGYENTGVELRLIYEDIQRWRDLPLEEAYAIADAIADAAGPGLRALDERLAAETQATEDRLEADDILPEEEMDAVFGLVPEPRDYVWAEGRIVRADVASSGDHVVALVDLADGTRKTMAMFAVFGTPAELLSSLSDRIGVDGRLCVGRVNAFDEGRDIPAGFDRSMPLLEMAVAVRDVPGIARLYAKAA